VFDGIAWALQASWRDAWRQPVHYKLGDALYLLPDKLTKGGRGSTPIRGVSNAEKE